MNSDRQTAIIVAVFFLIGYVVYLPAAFLLESILTAPDYLISVSANQTQVIMGVLGELANAAAVAGIAILLFPILKKRNETLALWYVVFRALEAVVFIVADVNALSLITLSQEYAAAGAPDTSYFQAAGTLALAQRYWVTEVMSPIFFVLSALVFYYLLYQTELLPRFISIWGFIAVALLIIGNVLGLPFSIIGLLLFLPIMSNEIFLAIWLIVKGFNPSAIVS
jgi:hypothetical protein